MEPTHLLIIFAAICFCALLAHRLHVASPIAFLIGGVALALVPGMPQVNIDPEYMLLIFLPPILMEAAFFTSIRDFRKEMRAIILMAVGLVVATTAAVGLLLVQFLPGAT